MNETVSSKAFVNIQKINDTIRRAFNRSRTLYLYKDRSKSDDEYEWSEEFQKQLKEFEKEIIEKLKLTDLEAIEIIKKNFVKRDIELNIFMFELPNEKLTRIS